MTKFKVKKTPINGLVIIETQVFFDDRGFFLETYSKKEFKKIGINKQFVQDNHSKSKKGVLRGLHFQTKKPQGKLVRVIKGRVYDIAVDLRRNSPTFSNYFGIILSELNKLMLYIPEGFAHGFLCLTDEAEVVYKTTNYYYPEYDSGIRWDDPMFSIKWPFSEYNIKKPILSKKDMNLPYWKDIKITF